MTRLTRLCRAVGVGLAAAAATLSMTQVGHAQPAALAVPEILVPRPGNEQFLVAEAKGVQIYQCTKITTKTPNTFEWTFREPVADLVGDGGQLIKHSIGPKWAFEADGSAVSLVKGAKATPAPSPAPDRDIPWLLVPVEATGSNLSLIHI